MAIRIATSADAALLAAVGADTFRETFAADNTPANMAAFVAQTFGLAQQAVELRDHLSQFLIAEAAGEVAGYARIRCGRHPACVDSSRAMEINRLYARRRWIGHGVGAALMARCIDEAQHANCDVIWLGVWERNPRAIAFYERWGFRVVGEQVFILGSDAQRDLVMARSLSELNTPVA